MKKSLFLLLSLMLSSCAQDAYRLRIDNQMNRYHGQSIYFRSNMRSNYAGQIRRVLSDKFSETGMKTATSVDNADFVAIFDIETFYKQDKPFKNTSFVNTIGDAPLFTSDDESHSLSYTGNANMSVDRDKTCFTLNIGKKDTSDALYNSTFCANEVVDTENMVPMVNDIYGQYANYEHADVGVQCLEGVDGSVACQPLHDRQQAFINSLWVENRIIDEEY